VNCFTLALKVSIPANPGVVTLAQSGARESALHAVARGDYARISHKVVSTLSELYLALSEFQKPGSTQH
jgi:hypothetical protein